MSKQNPCIAGDLAKIIRINNQRNAADLHKVVLVRMQQDVPEPGAPPRTWWKVKSICGPIACATVGPKGEILDMESMETELCIPDDDLEPIRPKKQDRCETSGSASVWDKLAAQSNAARSKANVLR